jgi:hypothetical protein
VALIKTYLSGRYQSVCVVDEIYSFTPILRGVYKGSILVLVLFSLFISDLLEVIMFIQAQLYPDDVQIYVSSDVVRAIEKLNTDVCNVTLKFSSYNHERKFIPYFQLSSKSSS